MGIWLFLLSFNIFICQHHIKPVSLWTAEEKVKLDLKYYTQIEQKKTIYPLNNQYGGGAIFNSIVFLFCDNAVRSARAHQIVAYRFVMLSVLCKPTPCQCDYVEAIGMFSGCWHLTCRRHVSIHILCRYFLYILPI